MSDYDDELEMELRRANCDDDPLIAEYQAKLAAAEERAELAERRNLLNPESTAYVDELGGALDEAQQENARLKRALESIRDGGHEASAARKAVIALEDDADL